MAAIRDRVVVDASLAINMVLPGQPYWNQSRTLARHWEENNVELIAPPLYENEVDSVIRYYIHLGRVSPLIAEDAQRLLDALPVMIVQDARVRLRAREIAAQFNQRRVYDATYAALAEVAGCEFWTAVGNSMRLCKTNYPILNS